MVHTEFCKKISLIFPEKISFLCTTLPTNNCPGETIIPRLPRVTLSLRPTTQWLGIATRVQELADRELVRLVSVRQYWPPISTDVPVPSTTLYRAWWKASVCVFYKCRNYSWLVQKNMLLLCGEVFELKNFLLVTSWFSIRRIVFKISLPLGKN